MKISIGTFDSATKTVPVTFTEGDVVHKRPVNAVLDDKGGYDRVATKARVEEVANGVAVKIATGAITNPPPPVDQPTPPPTPAA